MTGTPYDNVSPMQRWSGVANGFDYALAYARSSARFAINADEAIASAGSCFAGRLAEWLGTTSQPYVVTEPAPAWITDSDAIAYGYRPFSARYGLVYSTTQLVQLFDRAYGTFDPIERAWDRGGVVVDPFRPRTNPAGYRSIAELEEDRRRHLAAVRRAFESCDIFVFTAGLTETWRDVRDGAVFPYCPGLAGGTFDASKHVFVNTGVTENIESLERFVTGLRAINPTVRIILTVSPVPLGATFEQTCVTNATTHSKSVLRVAIEEIRRAHEFVDYFPSYELISQTFFDLDPFLPDRRHIKPEVVSKVTQLFNETYLSTDVAAGAPEARGNASVTTEVTPCDEDIFAR